MSLIQTTSELKALCSPLAHEPFIAVDTEFIREKTYYPQLCILQVAAPGGACFAVDVLAEGMNLQPLYALFDNPKVVKVFHACRQDIEIILHRHGKIPFPLFDTQVAAMVCGFGDSASYGALAEKYLGIEIDKSHRFTNWARRPLSKEQYDYALNDVRHLCDIYQRIDHELKESGRDAWVAEEMANLQNKDVYITDVEEVWKKMRLRSHAKCFTHRVKELAKWREIQAQHMDVPRGFVLKDNVLLEIAAAAPQTIDELMEIRAIPEDLLLTPFATEVLDIIAKINAVEPDDLPTLVERSHTPSHIKPVVELLRLLLKQQCMVSHVAEKLVANDDDLHVIAKDEDSHSPSVPAMYGWRYEIFGKFAMELKKGNMAFTLRDGKIVVIPLKR
ncbi:MAG: ribonuclease D [Alphaproteobacteria bacterium]|nr:ribonuclease D [Alphaproteobacteria bacterium]